MYLDQSLLVITSDEKRHGPLATGRGETAVFSITGSGSLQSCPINSLPYLSLKSASGGLLKSESANNVYFPVTCGSPSFCSATMDCYDMTSGKAIVSDVMFRQSSASVSIYNGTALWLTGGKSCFVCFINLWVEWEYVKSTELIRLSGDNKASSEPWWDLPMEMGYHCLQTIDDGGKVVLFGGLTDWSYDYSEVIYNSYVADLNSNHEEGDNVWLEIDSLNERRASHACGVMRLGQNNMSTEIVVAAGGRKVYIDFYANEGGISSIDTVEFLAIHQGNIEQARWEYGPKLPTTLSRAASATTKSGTSLYIAGGLISEQDKIPSMLVLRLHCIGDTVSSCSWTKDTFELWHEMSASVAMIIPPFSKVSAGNNHRQN